MNSTTKSTIPEARAVVERALAAMSSGDFPAITAEVADEATWEIVGGTFFPQGHRFVGRAAIERDFIGDVIVSVFDFDAPFELKVTRVDAAGSRVYVTWEIDATATRGGHYQNEYLVIFTVEHGLITSVREFTDTARQKRVFFG